MGKYDHEYENIILDNGQEVLLSILNELAEANRLKRIELERSVQNIFTEDEA